VEWSCSLPQLAQGKVLQVSRGVTCSDSREPLGVVASVVPFNFPIMVPMWTIPIALTMGNCMILKPSEKCPMTMNRVAQLIQEAGVPDGVFQIVNGTAEVVNALCDSPGVSAVTFVGSSKVAEIVSKRCHALNKRTLCLGGAKNHLVAAPDADVAMAAADITSSFAGCAGQRCMAASVLLTVGEQPELIQAVVEKAKKMTAGQGAGQMGPVIDKASQTKILKYIDEAEAGGATILLDGRKWASEHASGTWVGPTVILHKHKDEPALHDEIFGPVLSVLSVATKEEAMKIENDNPHGNAACVYTLSGGEAEWYTKRFRAAMLGVNIGIPVPREPFSFGGLYGTLSKFGDHDITADGAMEFFSTRRKVTSKWMAFGGGGNSSALKNGAKEERDLAQFGAFEAADK
jgi:malonate-semialdehyde dehydrogenase (acetylating)/methylmalonate-semialdehyde dehydrogenase